MTSLIGEYLGFGTGPYTDEQMKAIQDVVETFDFKFVDVAGMFQFDDFMSATDPWFDPITGRYYVGTKPETADEPILREGPQNCGPSTATDEPVIIQG